MKVAAWTFLLGLYVVAYGEPGGYLFWGSFRPWLAGGILVGLLVVAWGIRSVGLRFALLGGAVVLGIVQWGGPALRRDACGCETTGSMARNGTQVQVQMSSCGATTGDLYQVVLQTGSGWRRRQQVLVKAYMDPRPELENLDSQQVWIKLHFELPDSVARLGIVWGAPGGIVEYYRGKRVAP